MCIKFLKILCCCKRKKKDAVPSEAKEKSYVLNPSMKVNYERGETFFMMAGTKKSYPYIEKTEEKDEKTCISLSAPHTRDYRGEKEQVKIDRPPPLVDFSFRPLHMPHKAVKRKRKKKRRRRRPLPPPEPKPVRVVPSFRQVKPCIIRYYPEELISIPKRVPPPPYKCANYWKTSKLTVKYDYQRLPMGCVSLSHPSTRDYVESESTSNSDENWDLPNLLSLPPPIPCDVKVDGFFLRPLPFAESPSPEPEPEKPKLDFKMETAKKQPPAKLRKVPPCKPWHKDYTYSEPIKLTQLKERSVTEVFTNEKSRTEIQEKEKSKIEFNLNEKSHLSEVEADEKSSESEIITCKSISPDKSADFKLSKGFGTSTGNKFSTTYDTDRWRVFSTPAGKPFRSSTTAPNTPQTKILCNIRRKVIPNLRESPLKYNKSCKTPKREYTIPIDKADYRFACDKQIFEIKEFDHNACQADSASPHMTCPFDKNQGFTQLQQNENKNLISGRYSKTTSDINLKHNKHPLINRNTKQRNPKKSNYQLLPNQTPANQFKPNEAKKYSQPDRTKSDQLSKQVKDKRRQDRRLSRDQMSNKKQKDSVYRTAKKEPWYAQPDRTKYTVTTHPQGLKQEPHNKIDVKTKNPPKVPPLKPTSNLNLKTRPDETPSKGSKHVKLPKKTLQFAGSRDGLFPGK